MQYNNDEIERIKQLDIIHLARKLGLDVSAQKRKIKCFVHDDKNPSLSFNVSKKIWKCFSCSAGGSNIDLIMAVKKCDFKSACDWAKREYSFNSSISTFNTKKKSIVRIVNPPVEKVINPINSKIYKWIIENTDLNEHAFNFLVNERKFKPEIISQQQIKSIIDYNSVFTKAVEKWGEKNVVASGFPKYIKGTAWSRTPILFPYFNLENKIIYIQARSLNPIDPKERFANLKGIDTYIYNAPVLNTLNYGDDLFIFEGVTDCLAALSYGINAIAIPGATSFKDEYIELIKDYNICMFPDNDNAGKSLFNRIQTGLNKYCVVIDVKRIPNKYKDFCDLYINEFTKR